jgi:hypothetical protein
MVLPLLLYAEARYIALNLLPVYHYPIALNAFLVEGPSHIDLQSNHLN